MFKPHPRTALTSTALAAAVACATLTGPGAQALTGSAATGQTAAFTARIDIGDNESTCSGVLVESQWLLTSATCFSADGHPAAGAPAKTTKATIGRTDLASAAGQVRNVVQLVPRTDRDVVLARLDKPVTTVAPAPLAGQAPAAGTTVTVAGYGRTKTEWSPLKLHTGTFTVGATSTSDLPLTGQNGATICAGDTGAPAVTTVGGKTELVGISSRSWQGGCFGTDDAETRTDALDVRVDDLAGWVSAHVARWGLKAEANGKYVAGEFSDAGNQQGKLRARSDAPTGSWEQFALPANGTDGGVSLRSQYNDLYVSVEVEDSGSHAGMLRARATSAGSWERFQLERQSNGNYALKASKNGKYVSTEINDSDTDNGLLRARNDTVGAWERFTFTRADNYPTASRDTVQPGPLPAS
ncbi:trypsin-like serine protease [Streptomyces sp. NPDC016845]|uniref:trypsin-like serine protease n=1 Tax=Streptomyces sp. NPDC016845 TaxID=3364972 RepID=UPI003791641B